MDANIQPNFFNDDFTKRKYSYLEKFGILSGLVIGGFILAAVIQLSIMLTMINFKDIFNLKEETLFAIMAKPENFTKTVLMQGLGTLVLMAIPAFVYAKIVSNNAVVFLGFNRKISIKQVLFVVGIAIAGMILSGSLGELTKVIIPNFLKAKADKMEAAYEAGVMMFVNMKSFGDYLFSLLKREIFL
ncbi:MAG: hypothetical protein WCO04_10710 [Pseudomonadota bacterium]